MSFDRYETHKRNESPQLKAQHQTIDIITLPLYY